MWYIRGALWFLTDCGGPLKRQHRPRTAIRCPDEAAAAAVVVVGRRGAEGASMSWMFGSGSHRCSNGAAEAAGIGLQDVPRHSTWLVQGTAIAAGCSARFASLYSFSVHTTPPAMRCRGFSHFALHVHSRTVIQE